MEEWFQLVRFADDFLFVSLSQTIISLQVDHVSMAENGPHLTDRSQMVRDRLHSKIPFGHVQKTDLYFDTSYQGKHECVTTCFSGGSFSNSTWALRKKISRAFSGASYLPEPMGYEIMCVVYFRINEIQMIVKYLHVVKWSKHSEERKEDKKRDIAYLGETKPPQEPLNTSCLIGQLSSQG